MTDAEKREAARMLFYKWKGRGKEDEDDRSFWFDILQDLMGFDRVTDRIEFQKKVIGADGNTKRIDAYIPEVRVLIEQKSIGIALDKPQSGHNGMTPYEQAKMYNDCLPFSEKARWIVLSNFAEIWIYDMDQRKPEPVILQLENLQTQYTLLDFLEKKEKKQLTKEMELSLKAGELVGLIHDRFLEQYSDPMAKHTQRSLNILCTRLVFCLFAEDAGLFGERDAFSSLIASYEPKDIRRFLLDLFKVLDTPLGNRAELYLDEDLAAFPYVNGGLFRDENIVVPRITDEIKAVLLESSKFDWSSISPTIFGAVFESTLNPETRRSGGMHYTSIENIHKVIDPLFLDDLKAEFEKIRLIAVDKVRQKKLSDFQGKLSRLKFLDPACGSGNFLTETYCSLRRLENRVLFELNKGQITFAYDDFTPIRVNISQFYGIEINDFAVTVAKTALWIAESQMMKETEDVVHMNLDFLPLKTNASIIEGNALQLDWEKVVPKNELTYIMGNPPFVGARWMNKQQKDELLSVFGKTWVGVGDLDYVCAWYKKCSDLMKDTNIRAAFVSTNSITQGGAVANIWKPLFADGLHFDFAYRTFIWNSEARFNAKVHCVIIGFSHFQHNLQKRIFDGESITVCSNINGYLLDADNVFIDKRMKPISDVPQIALGGQAIDDGNLILTEEDVSELLIKEPQAASFIRPYMMGKDFIERKSRYCLWLQGVSPAIIKQCPLVMERVRRVKEFREKSERSSTLKAASTPTLFASINVCDGKYVAIPKVSSQNRRYIPMDFLDGNTVAGDKLFIMPDAGLYEFGVLTSNVHMSWTRSVCGRLKSDYSYSNTIVYNNFPWPTPTAEQKAKIEQTAQAILDAREQFSGSSLSDLYDPLTMPIELLKAHMENDKAVMRAYGFDIRNTTESDCVAHLMKLYAQLTEQEV